MKIKYGIFLILINLTNLWLSIQFIITTNHKIHLNFQTIYFSQQKINVIKENSTNYLSSTILQNCIKGYMIQNTKIRRSIEVDFLNSRYISVIRHSVILWNDYSRFACNCIFVNYSLLLSVLNENRKDNGTLFKFQIPFDDLQESSNHV